MLFEYKNKPEYLEDSVVESLEGYILLKLLRERYNISIRKLKFNLIKVPIRYKYLILKIQDKVLQVKEDYYDFHSNFDPEFIKEIESKIVGNIYASRL